MVSTVFSIICSVITVFIMIEFAILVLIAVHEKFRELNLKLLKYFKTKGSKKNAKADDRHRNTR